MKGTLIISVVLLCLLAPVAMADDITLTSAQKEYFFPLGDSADISLGVASSFDHPVDGTFQFTTVEQLQNAGSILMSTKNRVYPRQVPPGKSLINISAGTSSVEKSLKVQITYYYAEPSPVTASIPEILIHFVKNMPQQGNSGTPVSSTSVSGGSAPAGSSVQLVQQSVSVQQQAGRDGGTGQSLQNSQLPQDMSALKDQLQREAVQKEADEKEFSDRIERDPLFSSVNRSLAAEGFVTRSRDLQPTSGENGTFSLTYGDTAGNLASLEGVMTKGIIPAVIERSSSPVQVPPALQVNATYKAFTDNLTLRGFSRNETTMEFRREGNAATNITYSAKDGNKAALSAVMRDGNVTSLLLDPGTEPASGLFGPVLPIFVAAAFGIVAWLVYRKYFRGPQPVPLPAARDPSLPGDFREEAIQLLQNAERAFTKERYSEAYGYAGQALRLTVSQGTENPGGMTSTEILSAIGNDYRRIDEIRRILVRCEDVEFARGTPHDDEFPHLIQKIRELIDSPQPE